MIIKPLSPQSLLRFIPSVKYKLINQTETEKKAEYKCQKTGVRKGN